MTNRKEALRDASYAGYSRGSDHALEELTAAYDLGFEHGSKGFKNPEIRPWLKSRTYGEPHSRFWRFQNYAYDVGFRDGYKKFSGDMDLIHVEMLKRDHRTK